MKDKQLATSVQVYADMRIGPSLFYVLAMPRPGVEAEDLEKAIYEEIEAVRKDGVTEREMEKARTQFRRGQIQARQSALTTAIRLSEFAVKFDDPDLINEAYRKLIAVTREEVKKVAEEYLVPRERAVITTLPGKQAGQQAAGL